MSSKTHKENTLDALKAARKLLRGAGTAASREVYWALSNSITTVGYEIERDKQTAAEYEELMKVGKSAADSLREMVAALSCDYDRLEYLADVDGIDEQINNLVESDEATELVALREAAGWCESREDAEQRIHEDALEVTMRGDWHELGDGNTEPVEFRILLSTGGPASRIVGTLGDHGEPEDARLEVQDWFQPWTEYREDGLHSVLMAYSACFYFGK